MTKHVFTSNNGKDNKYVKNINKEDKDSFGYKIMKFKD